MSTASSTSRSLRTGQKLLYATRSALDLAFKQFGQSFSVLCSRAVCQPPVCDAMEVHRELRAMKTPRKSVAGEIPIDPVSPKIASPVFGKITVIAGYFSDLAVSGALGCTTGGRQAVDLGGHKNSGPPSAAGTCWTVAAMNAPTSPIIRIEILIASFAFIFAFIVVLLFCSWDFVFLLGLPVASDFGNASCVPNPTHWSVAYSHQNFPTKTTVNPGFRPIWARPSSGRGPRTQTKALVANIYVRFGGRQSQGGRVYSLRHGRFG